ncbi:MAG TPA: hypothetical protein VF790_04260 [Dissulfurispiraceae bacterium]
MNTGPYSNENVQSFIMDYFVPVKSQCFWEPPTELMKQFNVKWTPTLLVLGKDGREHHRIIGYVPVNDFLAHLGLGRGKVFFDTDHFSNAIQSFSTVIDLHPDSGVAPEAVFFRGVAEYKKAHNASALRWVYDTLIQKYPESEWARRAAPYAQIPAYAAT